MKKAIFIILVIVLICVSGFRLYMLSKERQRPMSIPKINVMKVKKTEITDEFNTIGRIEAKYSVNLQARVQGYLEKRNFNEGEFVNKGDVLFIIEPYEHQANLDKAKADLESAKATLYEAEKNLLRIKELVAKDFVSKSEYDNAFAAKNRANANLNLAQAKVDQAELNLSYTKIKAPISGRIGKIQITEGNFVNKEKGALASIVSLDPVYVTFNLPTQEFLKIQKDKSKSIGRKVKLILPDNSVYQYIGSEDFYNNQIDEATGTIQYRATFKNPDYLLLPGGFVKVSIHSNNIRNEILVPQNAVLEGQDGKFVYAINNENAAIPKIIVAQETYENNWIIQSGLDEGDVIALNGFQSLMPNSKVEILNKEKDNDVQ